jgi:predicted nucleotidyltransferase
MRITEQEKLSIKETFNSFFKKGNIYLFGSRVNDTKKGGDIDLYLVPETRIDKQDLFTAKISFLSKLKQLIGEQQIDVVIAIDSTRDIEKAAIKTGILL